MALTSACDGFLEGGGVGDGGDNSNGDSDPLATECSLSFEGKQEAVIPNPTGNLKLTRDKVWVVQGITYVADGQTLTIEPCTRIEGEPLFQGQPAVLVVSRGGKIEAAGTQTHPILVTGRNDIERPGPGDWGGIILLGRAPNNSGNTVLIEGLESDPRNMHGGNDPEDNSGTITYARIENSGFELTTDVEVNGLTMGSVGRGTTLHHIMVVNNLDDCFEWFGGTVDAHHLIADACGDDMFDMDLGYTGSVHTLIGRMRLDVISSSNPHGWECDNSPAGADPQPVTRFTGEKVTLCGAGQAGDNVAYGAVLRRGVTGALKDNVFVGFDDAVSLRDPFGTPEAPRVTIESSQFFGNFRNPIGVAVSETATNPNPIDPIAWFEAGSGNAVPASAPFTVAQCNAAAGPTAEVTGSGIGAFKDESDWATGAWVRWSTYRP
jgi:hypothetical protein